MSAFSRADRTAPDATKENRTMSKRFTTITAVLGAVLAVLAVSPVASVSAAEPWWQIVTGSRPTNMWEPTDNEQELDAQKAFGLVFAAKIEIGGEVVGCLGAGEIPGLRTADQLCEEATPYDADETAADLEATLEAAYGVDVEVSGGPATTAPFEVTVPGRAVLPVRLSVIDFFGTPLGTAKARVLSAGGSGRLIITVTNLGNAPVDATMSPVTILDKMPEGVEASAAEGVAGVQGKAGPVECSVEAAGTQVSCSFEGELPSYEAIEIEVLASLTGEPPVAGAPGNVTVSGANASQRTAVQEVEVSDEPAEFGFEHFSVEAEDEGGAVARQAGGHPFQLTTTLQFNSGHQVAFKGGTTDPLAREFLVEQPALPRNLRFPLPAGLVGNARVTATCPMSVFFDIANLVNQCPDDAAIGVTSVTIVESNALGLTRVAVPVFNLPPAYGQPARFGFVAAGVSVIIDTSVNPDDDYKIIASVRNVAQVAQFLSSSLSLWGTPGHPRHDSSRGWNCAFNLLDLAPCEPRSSLAATAFLRQPVSCAGPLDFEAQAEPWNVPLGSVVKGASFTADPLVACNRVPFAPKVAAAASSKLAETPSGLDYSLTMPNSGLDNPDGIAEGQPKKVEVTLPEGMTLNPSAAEGLATCSPAQYAAEKSNSRPGEGCPDASKIGNVRISTPLLKEEAVGALYQASPNDNPFGSLLAVYLVARVPERGILVKLAGKVSPDPRTGQIVTVFDDAPQLPFSSFDLNFREGGRAPLVTPPTCGEHEIVTRFTPWSAQDPNNPAPNEIVTRKSTFEVQRGVDGGACPPGGVPPFNPGFEAGSINNNAASYSPFYMRLTRKDGEQGMTKFSSVLPPGVLGKLAGVDKCPEAAIAAAKAKSGKEELAAPSCPPNSAIGRTVAGAGVGSVLTYVPGQLYLAGPYNGAPLSVVAITSAVAGPFDVGTVVVREALDLDPRTAEVHVDGAASDPIPHILAGIPLRLRDLRVYVDRGNFILNPTSCEESSTKATLFGSFLDVFSAADDVPVGLASRYQAANCANLGFKPKLGLRLKGGTRRGANPGLRAVYTPRKGDANLKGMVVRLPRSAFLDQSHIRTICTRVQWAAKACPKAAQYGYIRAWTPLLDEPLQGPVYLRSSNNKLPDMVFDLKGIVDVEVATRIDSVGGGIRAKVMNAPDAPISRVVLNMQGGRKGLIVNSRNLCAGKNRAQTRMLGHNGRVANLRPLVRPVNCKKQRKGSKGQARRSSAGLASAAAVR